MRLLVLLVTTALVVAMAPLDLDVGIPSGSPFDSIKIPKDSPTGDKRPGTASGDNKPAPPKPGKAGETVAEDPKKAPPPKPPSGLPGISQPTTVDYQQHLGWTPKDDMVEYHDPTQPAVPTGPRGPDKPPEAWDVGMYPPAVPNDLYVYGVCRFLMVMVHPAQVSERELTQFLIEMGYPAYYAATAAKGEARVKRMCDAVIAGVGPMVKTPPNKPGTDTAAKVYMDLIRRYVYDREFASWTLSQPTEVTLPVLLDIVKSNRHPFLLRNAVFVLRCYNAPEVVPVLRDLLLKSGDKVIRNRALAALVRWQDEGIVDWLVKQSTGSDVSFRNYAIWALGRIGSPVSVDRILMIVQQQSGDGEFLWTAIPALGYLGENAPQDKKDKIIGLLQRLEPVCAAIKDPPHYDGEGLMAPREADPPNATSKILTQRIKLSLALLRKDPEVAIAKKWTDTDVMVPNRDFLKEVQLKLGP